LRDVFYKHVTPAALNKASEDLLQDACVSIQFDLSHAAFVFRRADLTGNGMAGLFEAREFPKIGKLAALLRLDRLDGAIAALKKNAGAVRLFQQREAATIPTQAGELLDEIVLAHAFERGEPGDFSSRQTHLSRPATAGRATLTFEKNRHT
jgi:hypothetical protein